MAGSPTFSAAGSARFGAENIEARTHVLLVFQLADRLAAFPVDAVERIAPLAELARPPGLPSTLEGVLNLAGTAIPVLRLDRLFRLPAQHLSLYAMLIILRAVDGNGARAACGDRIAILVDRAREILSVPEEALRRVERDDSFNACAEAIATIRNESIHVLSPARIVMAKEREALAEFQAMAQQRLQEWKAGEV
jgi:purine-binding chemotaxis protein CheW